MMGRVVLSLALLALAGSPLGPRRRPNAAWPSHLIERDFALPQVARAIVAKQLDILVVGAGSSMLPGPNGVKNAYPARLQQALGEKLPGVEVKVTTDVKAKRTAAEMVKIDAAGFGGGQARAGGLADRNRGRDAVGRYRPIQQWHSIKGINIARSAGADVVLINAQYSPRTESMIALGTYAEDMRWVALQQEVPLFDRFSIMKLWADLGTFDLYSPTKKLDTAEQVHDCIGRLLADLVIESAKPDEPHAERRPLTEGRGTLLCRATDLVCRAIKRIAAAALLAALAMPLSARAETPAPTCDTPLDLIRLANPLPHLAQKLAAGEPITIVAIGSSSTAGAGASSPANKLSEPARGRTRNAFPEQFDHRAQSRRQRRGSRRHAQALRPGCGRCQARPGLVAARHQFGHPRSQARPTTAPRSATASTRSAPSAPTSC